MLCSCDHEEAMGVSRHGLVHELDGASQSRTRSDPRGNAAAMRVRVSDEPVLVAMEATG